MILSKIDNVQPEQKPINDSTADNSQVIPAIGNTNVGCCIMSYDFFRKNCDLHYKTISTSRFMFLKTNGFKKLTGDEMLIHADCYRNWELGKRRETPLEAVSRYVNEYFGNDYNEFVYYSIDKCNVAVYGR